MFGISILFLGDALIGAFVDDTCFDLLTLLPDSYLRSAIGCPKYCLSAPPQTRRGDASTRCAECRIPFVLPCADGTGLFAVNNTLTSFAEMPGVGEIVACLSHEDKVYAWEYSESMCSDVCSCGDAGLAFGCLNTAGCCDDISQMLLLFTNVLAVLCLMMVVLFLVSIWGARYVINFFQKGSVTLQKTSTTAGEQMDELEAQDQGREDGNVTVRALPLRAHEARSQFLRPVSDS